MTESTVIHLATQALIVTIKVSGPFLIAGLAVGLLISVFQALTQINEQTLTFVPKIIAVFGALLVAGPWLMSTLVSYTSNLFAMLPAMVR